MSSVRVSNRSRLCGSSIRRAVQAAAKSVPRSKSGPRAGPRRNSKKTRLISGRDAHRCRSEMKKTAKGPLDHFRPLDDHVLDGHVGVTPAFSGLDLFDLVDHVLALDDLAEHAVAPTLGVRRRMIEKIVVLDADEKLAGGRMRF